MLRPKTTPGSGYVTPRPGPWPGYLAVVGVAGADFGTIGDAAGADFVAGSNVASTNSKSNTFVDAASGSAADLFPGYTFDGHNREDLDTGTLPVLTSLWRKLANFMYIGPQQQSNPAGGGPGCQTYPLDPKCQTQPKTVAGCVYGDSGCGPVAAKTIHKVRGNNGLVETRDEEELSVDSFGYRG